MFSLSPWAYIISRHLKNLDSFNGNAVLVPRTYERATCKNARSEVPHQESAFMYSTVLIDHWKLLLIRQNSLSKHVGEKIISIDNSLKFLAYFALASALIQGDWHKKQGNSLFRNDVWEIEIISFIKKKYNLQRPQVYSCKIP